MDRNSLRISTCGQGTYVHARVINVVCKICKKVGWTHDTVPENQPQ